MRFDVFNAPLHLRYIHARGQKSLTVPFTNETRPTNTSVPTLLYATTPSLKDSSSGNRTPDIRMLDIRCKSRYQANFRVYRKNLDIKLNSELYQLSGYWVLYSAQRMNFRVANFNFQFIFSMFKNSLHFLPSYMIYHDDIIPHTNDDDFEKHQFLKKVGRCLTKTTNELTVSGRKITNNRVNRYRGLMKGDSWSAWSLLKIAIFERYVLYWPQNRHLIPSF